MNELISRQAAINALKRKQDNGKGDLSRFYNTIIQHDIEAIEQLPSTQPKIVRCKDCKNYKFGMCLYSMTSGVGKLPNGFCDWAERSEVME